MKLRTKTVAIKACEILIILNGSKIGQMEIIFEPLPQIVCSAPLYCGWILNWGEQLSDKLFQPQT